MKKLISIALCFVLLLALFCGCDDAPSEAKDKAPEKLSFEDSAAMEDYIYSGVWSCETTYNKGSIDYNYVEFADSYCIKLTLTRASDQSLEDMLTSMLSEVKTEDFTFNSFADFVLAVGEGKFLSDLVADGDFKLKILSIELEPENALIKETDSNVTYQFYDDDTMVTHGETYRFNENYNELESAFNSTYATVKEQKKQEFLNSYTNLATANQAKFSPYEYLGSKICIEGTAELDDYFNYEYRDLEMAYFCIRVTPPNGSYSDIWYIYGDRSTHKALFDKLQEDSISNLTIIAEGYFPDALSNQMATLYNYFIG